MAEQNKYEEWLSCIANTRLVFNTMSELESFLEAPSIHSNGIKRCFTSLQRIRSAFRDLSCEVDEITNDSIDLKSLLMDYKNTWEFYKENLDRRSDPSAVALELLRYNYPPYSNQNIGRRKQIIFEEARKKEINIPLLICFLLKVIPGYDSKNGDVFNIDELFDTTLQVLEQFTDGIEMYDKLPVVIVAREEPKKTRLSLIYHVNEILATYMSYAEQENMYEVSTNMKNIKVDLDIEGYWNQCGGQILHTYFWQIESTKDEGSFFATLWNKDANEVLTGIRYTLFLLKNANGNLSAYMMHPCAIKNRMNGLAYTDKDHVWYETEMPLDNKPERLPLKRCLASSVWDKEIDLTRVTDKKVVEIYDNWFKKCKKEKKFESLEYVFIPNIYAITCDAIFIPTEDERNYYKIPRESFEGFDQIQLTDNVGLLKMGGNIYLAFDEFLLYLPVKSNVLKKYGITIVDRVG